MPRRFLAVATTIVLAIAAGVAARLGAGDARAADPPVARVNARWISNLDVQVRLSELLPMASYHGRIASDKLLALRRTALDELVLDELIIEEARASGLAPDRREVDRQAEALRARFSSDEAFDEALAGAGMTRRAFRAYLERAVLVRRTQALHAPAEPTEADAAAYYEQHAARFVRPAQVRLLEMTIAIDPAGGTAAERRASARVDALLAQLRRGADFGRLAWDESADAYRVKSGEVGWVHRGRLDPDLEAAAFAAPLNELRTARSLAGFHIIKVTGRDPERQLTFDEARDAIFERMRRDRRETAERTWHDRLRSAARVEILDAALARARPIDIPRSAAALPGRPASPAPVALASH